MPVTQLDGTFIEDKTLTIEDVTDFSLDHTKLLNIGTRTHDQIDAELNLLGGGAGTTYAVKAMPAADHVISTRVVTKVNFNQIIHESNVGVYNTTTMRYTVPVDGIYQCVYLLNLSSTTTGRTMWYINGAEGDRLNSTVNLSAYAVTTNFSLSAGDFIEVYVYFNTGRTISSDYSHLCIHRIA